MLKYRFDVGDALERIGFNSYMAKTSGLLSQETLKKIKLEDTNINAKSINNLCLLLDMQPKDIFIYVESPEDLELKKKLQKNKISLVKVIYICYSIVRSRKQHSAERRTTYENKRNRNNKQRKSNEHPN